MAANFAFGTGSEKRKLFAYGYVLCAEITRIPLQIDFKFVSIVERFRGGRVWKQVKVVQIPMTKADLFLGIFEAIPGTLKRFEDFSGISSCWESSVTLFALPWLDAYFTIIQSAWSTNSVTVEELSECHKRKLEPFERRKNGLRTAII